MATICKLPSGKYNAQIRREGQIPLSATFKTKSDARAWATKIEDDINQGKHFGYSRVRTLADAVDAFSKSATTIKTADDRDRHLAWWREAFGHRKLFHFNADVVEQGREQLVAENIEPNPKKPARHRAPPRGKLRGDRVAVPFDMDGQCLCHREVPRKRTPATQ